MKKKDFDFEKASEELCVVLQALQGVSEYEKFLRDILTTSELQAMIDRWETAKALYSGTINVFSLCKAVDREVIVCDLNGQP